MTLPYNRQVENGIADVERRWESIQANRDNLARLETLAGQRYQAALELIRSGDILAALTAAGREEQRDVLAHKIAAEKYDRLTELSRDAGDQS